MLMVEQSYALLAPIALQGQHPDVLKSDDGRFEVRAQALADGSNMQMAGVSLRHDSMVTRLLFDYVGRLAAMASSDREDVSEVLAREDLRRKGVSLVHRQPLLSDPVKGPRRTSVLKWGDGLSLRAKLLEAEDGAVFMQLRLYLDTAAAGYVHTMLTDDGRVLGVVSGRTDQDAWSRIQGELNRHGYDVS